MPVFIVILYKLAVDIVLLQRGSHEVRKTGFFTFLF